MLLILRGVRCAELSAAWSFGLYPLINSPVSGHPPYFPLLSAYEIIRESGQLYQRTLFPITEGARLRES